MTVRRINTPVSVYIEHMRREERRIFGPRYYPGQWIEWATLNGDVHRGVIVEIEEGTAIVDCEDGQRRGVEL